MSELKNFRGIEGANFFEEDRVFKSLLKELLRGNFNEEVFASLDECGASVAGRWNDLANTANRRENEPRIIKFDRSGNAVEKIDFGPAVAQMRREVAESGLFTKSKNLIHKFAQIYLLAHNGESSLTCPISCTDGLIAALEAKGSEELKATYLPKILSTETPFAGAQFVTEHDAGSDVGAIKTTATPIAINGGEQTADGWLITGDKWFCSNPDEFFVVAARAGETKGTNGVGLFFVPRVMDGKVNNLSMLRLKDKLGTRVLPTAEIRFDDAIGFPIGPTDEGFKTLMNYVLNVSRIHNSVNACGFLHRAILEAQNYTRQRKAFGQAIINYPLVKETLLTLDARLYLKLNLVFKLISLVDTNGLVPVDENQAMWQRFLTNLSKYRTAVQLTDSIKEAILLFGGNGIVEDFTILPRLLRDSMIIETWEGAHNTLCLQIMRDIKRSNLLDRYFEEAARSLGNWRKDVLTDEREKLINALSQTREIFTEDNFLSDWWTLRNARRVVDHLGSLLELAWFAEFAANHDEKEDSRAIILTKVACETILHGEDSVSTFKNE